MVDREKPKDTRPDRFAWSDEDVRFLDENGEPLTLGQVKRLQDEARQRELDED